MPRKSKKVLEAERQSREAEILNSPPDMSNETVKALMSPEFETMSNLDASQIALMLQELVRGQASLLANAQQNSTQIALLRERQDQADKDIAERLAENERFIQETLDRAEVNMRQSGENQERLIAQGAAQYQLAIQNARAEKIANDLAFTRKLASEEKVTIVSPGVLVTTVEHGQQVSKIVPEEVHIKNIHMAIPFGRPVEVPRTIATYLEERRKSKEETAKRAELLSKNMEGTKLAQEWNNMGGSKTDTMPI